MLTAANFKFILAAGALYGYFSRTGLQTLEFREEDSAPSLLYPAKENQLRERTLHQLLKRYVSGESVSFNTIPLDIASGTPFQQRVWRAATTIPYGEYLSYGQLAQQIGQPGAARAVGSALGANPVCVVVPCHRILAANGRLGGFTAGLHWKRFLLTLEGIEFTEQL
ncbi:MAG: MGMT family protein [Candidatus Hydrogenedentes bacterium]|nr:MGMT family protein [Candidatus Hydrogenedentota bacterium]